MYKCATCGKDDCKLYRSYGGFFREEEVFCFIHVPYKSWGWYVPLVQDYENGGIWGYTSAREKDINIWNNLPENFG